MSIKPKFYITDNLTFAESTDNLTLLEYNFQDQDSQSEI